MPRPSSTARAIEALRALCGPVRPSAADQRVSRVHLGAAHPAEVRAEEPGLGLQLLVVAVGEGQRHPGLGAQRQLVGVVALDRAVPVEMVR